MNKAQSEDVEIHQYLIEVRIQRAEVNIKFPCRLLLLWKTASNKLIAKSIKQDVQVTNGVAQFNEKLTYDCIMVFDKKTERYKPRGTSIFLNLISTRKLEEKPVGKVSVDLAAVLNDGAFQQQQTHKMQYCSVKEGSLSFNIKASNKKITDLKLEDLDPDVLTEIQTLSKSMSQQSILEDQASQRDSQIMLNHQQTNAKLDELEKENEKMHRIVLEKDNEVKELQEKIAEIESDIVEELLSQVRDETEKKIEIEKSMKKINNELQQKLQQSEEKLRQIEEKKLQFQSQLLQLRFELSEMKAEKQREKQLLQQKETEAKIFKNQIQIMKKNYKIDAEFSPPAQSKEKEMLLNKIDELNRKVESLKSSQHLEGEQNDKFENLNNLVEQLSQEREKNIEEINNLQKQKFRIQEENNELKSGDSESIKNLLRKIDYSENQFNQLKDNLELLKKSNLELIEEIKNLEAEKDNVNELIKSLENENKKVFEKWQKQQKLNEEMGKAIEKIKRENQEIRKENEEVKKIILVNKKEYHNLETEFKLLEAELKRIDGENKKLEIQVKVSKKSKEDNKDAKSAYQSKIIELNKVRTELAAKNIRLENDIKNIELRMEKSQREFRHKEDVLREKVGLINYLNRQIEDQIHKNQGYELKLTKFAEKEFLMKETILILEQECQKVINVVIEKENIEMILNRIISDLEKDLEGTRMDLAEVKEKYFKNQEVIENLNDKIFQIKKDSILKSPLNEEDSDREYDAPEKPVKIQSINNLNRTIKLQQERIEELQKQMKLKRNEFMNELLSMKHKIESLTDQNEDLEINKIKKLQEEKNEGLAIIDGLEEEIKFLKNSIEDQEQKMRENEEKWQSYSKGKKEELKEQKNENYQLEKQIRLLKVQIEKYEQKVKDEGFLLEEALRKLQENQFLLTEIEGGKLTKRLSQFQDFDQIKRQLLRQPSTLNMAPNPLSPASEPKKDPSLSLNDIIVIAEELKKIMGKRQNREEHEKFIQKLLNKNVEAEDQFERVTFNRGVVQEEARKISMEFVKIKSSILKGKGNSQQKNSLISSLKPCEEKIKNLVNLTENLSASKFVELDQ